MSGRGVYKVLEWVTFNSAWDSLVVQNSRNKSKLLEQPHYKSSANHTGYRLRQEEKYRKILGITGTFFTFLLKSGCEYISVKKIYILQPSEQAHSRGFMRKQPERAGRIASATAQSPLLSQSCKRTMQEQPERAGRANGQALPTPSTFFLHRSLAGMRSSKLRYT